MLEEKYEDQESIPTGFEHLYVQGEEGEGFSLRAPDQIKTVDDTQALQNALAKERNDHKAVKTQLNSFDGLDPTEVRTQLDEIEVLRAEAKQNQNGDVDELVTARLNAKTAPLQRTIDQLTKDLDEKSEVINGFKTTATKSKINNEVTTALTESKVRSEALAELQTSAEYIFELNEDNLVVTKDGLANVPVGLTPDQWVNQKRETSPFYWPESQGADATGSTTTYPSNANPFDEKGGTFNMTEASKLIKTNPTKAKRLADAVGYKI